MTPASRCFVLFFFFHRVFIASLLCDLVIRARESFQFCDELMDDVTRKIGGYTKLLASEYEYRRKGMENLVFGGLLFHFFSWEFVLFIDSNFWPNRGIVRYTSLNEIRENPRLFSSSLRWSIENWLIIFSYSNNNGEEKKKLLISTARKVFKMIFHEFFYFYSTIRLNKQNGSCRRRNANGLLFWPIKI